MEGGEEKTGSWVAAVGVIRAAGDVCLKKRRNIYYQRRIRAVLHAAGGWLCMRAGAGRPSGEETGLLEHGQQWVVIVSGAGREQRELHSAKICAIHSCARNKWSATGVPNLLAALSVRASGVSAGSFNPRSGSTAFLTCLTGSYEIGECKISINILQ